MRETTDEVLDALVLDSSFFGQAQQSFTTRPIPAFEPSGTFLLHRKFFIAEHWFSHVLLTDCF
jgi:hypothetical protein